jgi:geranylgeranyl diphosphate synthase, type II
MTTAAIATSPELCQTFAMHDVQMQRKAGDTGMDLTVKLEQELEAALASTQSAQCPPKLAHAMRHAVFPGGARIRPQLLLAVTSACGAKDFTAGFAAAVALELLHCASLVHDDMPCFDGAAYRRGKPSVHVAFGERIAVLAGDALIVQAFEAVNSRLAHAPHQLVAINRIVAGSVGAPSGIAAGQAWECEDQMDLAEYQRAKTGALFAACTMAGAAAAERNPEEWRALGHSIGAAFQVADDIRDVAGFSDEIGKPVGQDAANGLPNMVSELGFDGAMTHFEALLGRAVEQIPPCPGQGPLARQIVDVSRGMVSKIARRAA